MVAAALGVSLGVVLTLVSHRAATFVTPNDPMRGLAIYGIFMLARMLTALLALGAYSLIARPGLAPFGFALGISFIVGLGFEAFRQHRVSTPHTSA